VQMNYQMVLNACFFFHVDCFGDRKQQNEPNRIAKALEGKIYLLVVALALLVAMLML